MNHRSCNPVPAQAWASVLSRPVQAGQVAAVVLVRAAGGGPMLRGVDGACERDLRARSLSRGRARSDVSAVAGVHNTVGVLLVGGRVGESLG
jgi:hypothetical protein